MRLKDKVALVTGAARGIGRAIARGLAREGAAVIVNDVPPADAAEALVREIRSAGGAGLAIEADVQELDQHARLITSALDEFGRLDILVNNAGVQRREPFLEARPDTWERTLGVNLKGVYFLSQRAAEAMRRGGSGKIVNVTSVHETIPLRHFSTYAISKAALGMLTKALALELAEYRINVNAIAPGVIATGINPHLADPETRSRSGARLPWQRVGEADDLVGAAVFLASPESDYVTGVTLCVDGGLLLTR